MKLEVQRFSSQSNSTLGMLFDVTGTPKFLCYTLEDEFRENKVSGETRIPSGTYNVTLRTEGGFNERYTEKFGASAGCLLVGDSQTQNITKNGFIGSSTDAYKRVYPQIADVLVNGGEVCITYVDYD